MFDEVPAEKPSESKSSGMKEVAVFVVSTALFVGGIYGFYALTPHH